VLLGVNEQEIGKISICQHRFLSWQWRKFGKILGKNFCSFLFFLPSLSPSHKNQTENFEPFQTETIISTAFSQATAAIAAQLQLILIILMKFSVSLSRCLHQMGTEKVRDTFIFTAENNVDFNGSDCNRRTIRKSALCCRKKDKRPEHISQDATEISKDADIVDTTEINIALALLLRI
jgi:hypothetical protein